MNEWVVPAEMLAKAHEHIARLRGVLALCGQAHVARESIDALPEVGDQMVRYAVRRETATACRKCADLEATAQSAEDMRDASDEKLRAIANQPCLAPAANGLVCGCCRAVHAVLFPDRGEEPMQEVDASVQKVESCPEPRSPDNTAVTVAEPRQIDTSAEVGERLSEHALAWKIIGSLCDAAGGGSIAECIDRICTWREREGGGHG